jgi:DNA polymerase-3 subunit gamma/tau
MEPAQGAHQLVAVPVRRASESVRDLAAQNGASLAPTAEGDFWFATVQALIDSESIAAMVRELALQAQLVARDSDQWLLRVERESLNQASTKERLANALRAMGHEVALAVEVGRVQDNPARRIRAAQEARQLGAEKIILEDPMVQALMQDFGAKIVPGSIKPL